MLANRLSRSGMKGKTLLIKWKYTDFTLHTKSFTFDIAIDSREEILEKLDKIFEEIEFEQPVRLLGLSMQKLIDPNEMSPVTEVINPQLRLDLEF